MRPRLWAGGSLAVVGGLLMLGSGYSSRGLLYTALGYAEPHVSSFIGGIAASATILTITVFELLIALGGVTVVIGGLVILSRHTTIGRTLIYLGGGAGLLGLVVSFGFSVYKLGGLSPVLSYLPYWVGLAMAVSARWIAKGG
jgi:hypothetical protein